MPPKNSRTKAGPEPEAGTEAAAEAPASAADAEATAVNGTDAPKPADEAATSERGAEAATSEPVAEAATSEPATGAAEHGPAGEEAASEVTPPQDTVAKDSASKDTASEDTAAEDTAAEEAASADEADGTQAASADAPAPRRSLRVPALLAVVIVLLGGFGVWATLKASNLRASNAQQNVALTDAATTSAVRQQVSRAVNQIFSYRYTDTAATRRAAQSLLTGRAIRQYDQLFSLVEKEAPAQKLVVTTTVTNSGVQFLSGDQARVLVYANQQDTRAGTTQSTYAGAMFAVTAVRAGNRWKIENIDTFAGR